MPTRTPNLLAFMENPPEGKYQVVKPTDEQLAAVLPWLVDKTVTWAHQGGHCATVNAALNAIVTGLDRNDGKRFFSAAGFDCYGVDRDGFNKDGYNSNTGYNREGFNRYGHDRDGFNIAGYNDYGYNRDGFNARGVDRNGNTREAAIAKLVGGWTKEHLAAVQAKLQERMDDDAAKAAEEEADKVAAAAEAETTAAGTTGEQAPVVVTEDEPALAA